jgi:hypothetical protein
MAIEVAHGVVFGPAARLAELLPIIDLADYRRGFLPDRMSGNPQVCP